MQQTNQPSIKKKTTNKKERSLNWSFIEFSAYFSYPVYWKAFLGAVW